MTDTPRTLAEVKALLADNTSQNISPQDLRDLVESIVDPVADGGFPQVPSAMYPAHDATWQRYDAGGIQSIASGYAGAPANVGTVDKSWDPYGLFQHTTYVGANGQTYQPWGWAILPPGVWLMTTVTTWEHSTGYRSTSSILVDDYATDYDGYIAVYGTTTPSGPLLAPDGNPSMTVGETITVPVGSQYRVGYQLFQASGTPKQTYWQEWSLKRLSA